MSVVYDQLARKEAVREEQAAKIHDAPKVQLEFALPELAASENPPVQRAKRLRQSAAVPGADGGFSRCELQTELSNARNILALNKEIISSLRRDLEAANAERQAAQEKLAALERDFKALKESNAVPVANHEPGRDGQDNSGMDSEYSARLKRLEEKWKDQCREFENKILQTEKAVQEARRALAEEQYQRQEERRQAAAREQDLKVQLSAACRTERLRFNRIQAGMVFAFVLIISVWGLVFFLPSCPSKNAGENSAEINMGKAGSSETAHELFDRVKDRLPVITLEGLSVMPVGDGIRIVFDKGLFSRRAVMTDEARNLLKELAKQLRSSLPFCRLKIIGHADPEPASDTDAPDNKTLGFQRAQAVAQYFADECGLSSEAMTVDSAGDLNTPYPNQTQELRRKNRTVTILLAPR